MHKGLYVLVGKEPIYEERSWFQLLFCWMLSKKLLHCLLDLHQCSPLTCISWGNGCKQGRAGWQLGRVMAAEGAGRLWYPVTFISYPPSFSVQSGAYSGAPFSLPKIHHSWMVSLHLHFCHAVFLFVGVSSQWTHYTCLSFLLNFFLCMYVCASKESPSLPFIASYLLLLPLCISNAHKGEGKWDCICKPICYATCVRMRGISYQRPFSISTS